MLMLRKRKKKRGGNRRESGGAGYESEESESVQLRPAYEVENSALYYIRADGNYLRLTTAKRAAHRFVIEKGTYCWSWGWSCGERLGHETYEGYGKIVTNVLGGQTR